LKDYSWTGDRTRYEEFGSYLSESVASFSPSTGQILRVSMDKEGSHFKLIEKILTTYGSILMMQ
jgi:hypothetical protein